MNGFVKVDETNLSNFESEMNLVLREIALTKLLEHEEKGFGNDSKNVCEAQKEAIQAYDKLYNKLQDEELKSMLLDIDGAYNRASACENDEHFISGFIMGYWFLKNVMGRAVDIETAESRVRMK